MPSRTVAKHPRSSSTSDSAPNLVVDCIWSSDRFAVWFCRGPSLHRLVGAWSDPAVARPQSSAFGEGAYPTFKLKAAALLHSIVTNHALVDGNNAWDGWQPQSSWT
jgi:hypothetical protein